MKGFVPPKDERSREREHPAIRYKVRTRGRLAEGIQSVAAPIARSAISVVPVGILRRAARSSAIGGGAPADRGAAGAIIHVGCATASQDVSNGTRVKQ